MLENLLYLLLGVALSMLPALMMQSYSRWNLEMARRLMKNSTDSQERTTRMFTEAISGSSRLAASMEAQAAQLAALDQSVGHIFAQTMSMSSNRTVLRRERQVGEDLPPFPGTTRTTGDPTAPTPPESIQEGFLPISEAPPRRPRDPALADPS